MTGVRVDSNVQQWNAVGDMKPKLVKKYKICHEFASYS